MDKDKIIGCDPCLPVDTLSTDIEWVQLPRAATTIPGSHTIVDFQYLLKSPPKCAMYCLNGLPGDFVSVSFNPINQILGPLIGSPAGRGPSGSFLYNNSVGTQAPCFALAGNQGNVSQGVIDSVAILKFPSRFSRLFFTIGCDNTAPSITAFPNIWVALLTNIDMAVALVG